MSSSKKSANLADMQAFRNTANCRARQTLAGSISSCVSGGPNQCTPYTGPHGFEGWTGTTGPTGPTGPGTLGTTGPTGILGPALFTLETRSGTPTSNVEFPVSNMIVQTSATISNNYVVTVETYATCYLTFILPNATAPRRVGLWYDPPLQSYPDFGFVFTSTGTFYICQDSSGTPWAGIYIYYHKHMRLMMYLLSLNNRILLSFIKMAI